jgi:hypothetical protein
MRDNALIRLIRETIIAQEAIAGIPGTPIAQAFQPTQQGVKKVPTAYIYKVGDRRRGYPERTEFWDEDEEEMIHTESQWYETTFQISALSIQDPADTDQLTASDIVNQIAYIMQSETTVDALQAQGVGVLKVNDVDNPYFTDDKDRNEAAPSFDVVVTHKQIVTTVSPVLLSTEFNIITV